MNGNKLKPKSPFFMSTQPNWTHFWILRANPTCLNPKIGPKIGLNPKKWAGFGRTSLHSGSHKSLSLGRSHKSLRFVIYCVAYWTERHLSLLFLQVKLSRLQFCFVSRERFKISHWTNMYQRYSVFYFLTFKSRIRFKQKRYYSFH